MNFKPAAPILILLLALIGACFVLFGDDSYSKLLALEKSLEIQKQNNAELKEYVSGLKRRVAGLQNDDRVLEKAARNELGLARKDELIVIFDRKREQVE